MMLERILTRLAAGVLAMSLLGAAAAAPVLVIGRTTDAAKTDLAILGTLADLPRLTTARGLAVARAYGAEDEDCLAVTRPDGAVAVSCAR